ncbi:hypothetical protein [Paenibacillus aestuarii]|uniref:Uncharacterized protein n=1 Tax=Paenibacillus aestuarii TaxID=516965 RepID=A0ABW0KAP3_9BACL|nr:hypothetical protein [Paenibacillus aestuarii]
MNMNIIALENLMLERKMEVEKAAAIAWQACCIEKKQRQIIRGVVLKFIAVSRKAQFQTSTACCCC